MEKWIYYNYDKNPEEYKRQFEEYNGSKFPVFCNGFLLDENECNAKFLSFYKNKSQLNAEGAIYFSNKGIAMLADGTEFKY